MTAASPGSINRTARLAGVLYLLLAVLGFFSFGYIPRTLFVPGNAAATTRNILESEALFRAGTVSHLVSQIVVVFLVLALYRIFEPANRNLAVLMVVFALLCVPISFLSELNHFAALRVLSPNGDPGFTASQPQTEAMLFLDLRRTGVLLAQIFWGFWLLALGAVILQAHFLPRLLTIPVVIAGAGYLLDSGTQLLFPGLPTISQFTALGEMVLPLWLLIRGVAVERWQHAFAART